MGLAMDKQTRLDVFVADEFNISREKSKSYILANKVFVNGKVVAKPSFLLNESDTATLLRADTDFVGRGGQKLYKAIEYFDINVKGMAALDIGASTGGFTDCMLYFGVNKIYAVDVGSNQLAEKLINDHRVINIENTHVLDLNNSIITDMVDLITIDVSFISVTKIISHSLNFLKKDGFIICLIKPQFETGPKRVGKEARCSKKGIVRSRKAHKDIIRNLADFFESIHLKIVNLTYSPIKGQKGNIEYPVLLCRMGLDVDFPGKGLGNKKNFCVEKVVEEAFSVLN